ncbi:hypothetical protein O6P43_006872, partial [Quillaja saponaria]
CTTNSISLSKFKFLLAKGIQGREKFSLFFLIPQWNKKENQWDFPNPPNQIDHNCKKRPNWVGLKTPGNWAPPVFNKLATATYLSFFFFFFSCGSTFLKLGSASPFSLCFPVLLSSAGTFFASSARAESHVSPKRLPLVRNSWAK